MGKTQLTAERAEQPKPFVDKIATAGSRAPLPLERGSIQQLLSFLKEKQIPIRHGKSPDTNSSIVSYHVSQMRVSTIRKILSDVPSGQIDHAELYEKNGIQTLDLHRWNAIIMRFAAQ